MPARYSGNEPKTSRGADRVCAAEAPHHRKIPRLFQPKVRLWAKKILRNGELNGEGGAQTKPINRKILWNQVSAAKKPRGEEKGKKAGDGIRTHDNDVGNVVLYQLSYTRREFHGTTRTFAAALRGVRNSPDPRL